MYEWQRLIQTVVDGIDESILAHNDEALTLRRIAQAAGYSEYHMTRKFREISGMIRTLLCCAQRSTPLTAIFSD